MILLRYIEQIINDYNGHPPLHHYLKAFFKQHPKLGSRDRKAMTEALYTFYRFAAFMPNTIPQITIIQHGLKFCHSTNDFLKKIINEHQKEIDQDILPNFNLSAQWPSFSSDIIRKDWLESLLKQPDLFIRIRQDFSQQQNLLKENKIPFEILNLSESKTCLRLPNGSKIDKLLAPKDYVVQDLSTQKVIFNAAKFRTDKLNSPSNVWDVCAGSGGKSILWKELFPQDKLFATDIRKSILHNFKERINLYGINKIQTAVLDLTTHNHKFKTLLSGRTFDYVICDVPCSGSGTWSRTPEQFYFFQNQHLKKFEALQLSIAVHAGRYLKQGGLLFYITCSVFDCENEAVINQIQKKHSFQLLHQELINGMSQKSDSIYFAVLKKV